MVVAGDACGAGAGGGRRDREGRAGRVRGRLGAHDGGGGRAGDERRRASRSAPIFGASCDGRGRRVCRGVPRQAWVSPGRGDRRVAAMVSVLGGCGREAAEIGARFVVYAVITTGLGPVGDPVGVAWRSPGGAAWSVGSFTWCRHGGRPIRRGAASAARQVAVRASAGAVLGRGRGDRGPLAAAQVVLDRGHRSDHRTAAARRRFGLGGTACGGHHGRCAGRCRVRGVGTAAVGDRPHRDRAGGGTAGLRSPQLCVVRGGDDASAGPAVGVRPRRVDGHDHVSAR